jgi:molybdenum cofactor cytidylyltransferase
MRARMITGVVLAAGASSRMGSHKLLLPLGGEPLVRRVSREVLQAGFDDVLVVAGYGHDAVIAAVEGLGVRHVVNGAYATGMGSSFRSAVAALQDSEAAMFALADQPLLTAAEYGRLHEAYRTRARGIVSVRYGDVTAPPHLFDRRYFPELERLEHGARPVLQRHAEDTIVLTLPPGLLLDVDTPEDYERARALVERGR